MAALRLEDVEMTSFTDGTANEFLSLPFASPDAAIPATPPCAVCLWGYALIRWARKRNLQSGSMKGCQFCRLITEIIRQFAPPLDDEAGIGIYLYGEWMELAWMTANKTQNCVEVYGVFDRGAFATCPTFSPFIVPPVIQDIMGDTGSTEALSWIVSMITRCDSQHDKCARIPGTPPPRRVLDLGEPPEGQTRVPSGDDVRLVDTNNADVDYVCLSHCWGTGPMFKTTKENLSDRKQTIILGDLPKTFRDAVEITRALKKRYLWIDSLCIIQNDGQDWQQEGLRMHEIYGNAYLTIVASKNRGPDEGLFSESPHHRLRDFSFTRDGGERSVLRVRRKVQHFNSADAFPLLRRGWVFQERILSRRVLHYGPQELVWECMEGEECECGRVDEAVRPDSNTPKKSLFALRNNPWLWNAIVSAHSALDLTRENDIFPALSGIMNKFNSAGGVRYLAGLWDGPLLLFGLLWYAEKKTAIVPGDYICDLKPRPSPCRAPSWSWASVKNRITYDSIQNWIEAVDVVGSRVVTAGRDPGGEVLYGEITLSGSAAVIGCFWPADSRNKFPDVKCNGGLVGSIQVYPDYDWRLDDKWWVVEGQPIHCLHIATTRGEEDKDRSDADENGYFPDDQARFLLLTRFNEEEPVFHRIGMAKLKWDKYMEQADFRAQFKDGTFLIC
jgi:hypothetical protein